MTAPISPCPECGAELVELLGIHHEIVAELRCLECGHEWSEQ